MSIHGLPKATGDIPVLELKKFLLYIPAMREWMTTKIHKEQFAEFNEMLSQQLNYGFWGEQWFNALSLGVAHYIVIRNPEFAQSTNADPAMGGVMQSRSVGQISYNYDVSKTMVDDDESTKFWNQTGYGRELVALSRSRGWVGVFIVS